MKFYLKLIGIAVVCGMIGIVGYAPFEVELTIINIMGYFSMEQITAHLSAITNIPYRFMPYIFFQIFFGVYIYKHFCTASIYYFSRNTKRTLWYIKQLGQVMLYCVLYLLILQLSAILSGICVTHVVYDVGMWKNLIYYLVIYSLYLFASTVMINILSIRFNNIVGFVVVELINAYSWVTFGMVGQYISETRGGNYLTTLIMRYNIFSYLVFGIQESTMNYVTCILVNLVLAIVVALLGIFVVNKYEFVENGKEG